MARRCLVSQAIRMNSENKDYRRIRAQKERWGSVCGKLLRRNNGRQSLAEGQERRDKDFNPLSPAEDFYENDTEGQEPVRKSLTQAWSRACVMPPSPPHPNQFSSRGVCTSCGLCLEAFPSKLQGGQAICSHTCFSSRPSLICLSMSPSQHSL